MAVSSRILVAAFGLCVVLLTHIVAAPAADAVGPGTIQFSAADYVTNESAGTVTLTLERVGGSVGEITATIQTHDGTATIVDDYAGIPSPLTLTWSDGNTSSKSVTLPIKSDTEIEGDETFTMDIVSAHAGTPSTATVTIENTPNGVIQFSAADYVTNEAAGTVTLTLERVGGSVGELTATIQTHDGTATIVDDYAGIPSPLTLTWSDGNTSSKSVTLPIKSDTEIEGDETFTMDIVSAHVGTPSTATVTITGTAPTPTPTPTATPGPTPTPPPGPTPTPAPMPSPTPTEVPVIPPSGTIEFSTLGYTTTEAHCSVAVELRRVGGSHGAASTVIATSPGSATGGKDYEPIMAFNPVRLTWSDGDASTKVINIKILEDGLSEADETFNVMMLETTGAGQGTDAITIVITETPVPGSLSQTGCASTDNRSPRRSVPGSSQGPRDSGPGAPGPALAASVLVILSGGVAVMSRAFVRANRFEF